MSRVSIKALRNKRHRQVKYFLNHFKCSIFGVGAFSLKGHVESDADELRGFD